MRKRKPRVINADERHPSVPIGLERATGAWFTYNSQAYPVSSAPTSIFKDAVLSLAPSTSLGDDDIDLVSRWWILCSLIEARRPMKLYVSRGEAERSLGQLDRSTAARVISMPTSGKKQVSAVRH